ncbi:TlpA family protein disulfide reductase [Kribbella qitaiheensis]|uniref:TlpA family protein disulfide reductase n=1 Tax=Kribbella qitaiheensis TaxID=1544730 RepID=UPI0019D64BCE|nr:redoxin family protein [Kribbella qitaiheensis]
MRLPGSAAALVAALVLGVTLSGCGAGSSGATTNPTTSATARGPGAASPPQTTATGSPGRSVPVGELAFTGTTLAGRPFDAATLAGKPVLLWFWAPWCPTCAAEAPDVLDVQQHHAGRLGVLGVAGLDDQKNMQPFVDRTKTGAITHLSDPTGQIWRRFSVTQQSTYVLLDAAGHVTFSGVLGGDDLRAKVAELTS